MFPQLDGVGVDFAWSGLMSYARHEMPQVGRIDDGLWLAQAFGSQLMYGPGKARHDDHGLAIYEAAGFAGEQADQVAVTMLTFVLGHALGAAAEASLTRKLGQDGRDGAALLRDRMAGAREIAARFPRLRARLDTAGAGYGASPEDSFEFGLQVILDGLQDRLASRP